MYDTYMRSSPLVRDLAIDAYDAMSKQSAGSAFDQLLTPSEKVTLGRRILIAQAIMAGKTRMEINEKIGVSPNTFAQINRWIEQELSQYASAHHKPPAPNKSGRKPGGHFTYADLKQKYPSHFLLFSLAERLFTDKKK